MSEALLILPELSNQKRIISTGSMCSFKFYISWLCAFYCQKGVCVNMCMCVCVGVLVCMGTHTS